MDLQELFYRYDSSDESSSESECKSANEDKFNTANGDLIKNSKYVLVLNKRIPEQKLFERLIFCIDVDPFNMQLKSDLDLNPATWSLYGALFGPQVPLSRRKLSSCYTDPSPYYTKIFTNNDSYSHALVVLNSDMDYALHSQWIKAIFVKVKANSVEVLDYSLAKPAKSSSQFIRDHYSKAVAESAILLGIPAAICNYCNIHGIKTHYHHPSTITSASEIQSGVNGGVGSMYT